MTRAGSGLHHQIADRTADLALSCVPAPKHILDVGCGTGYLLGRLAARGPAGRCPGRNRRGARVARVPDLHKTCVQRGLQHCRRVVRAQFKPCAEPGLLIIWCVVGELDAEMPAAGKADDEHRLADARELDRPRRAAANDGLKSPGQLLAPVRAREDMHVAAESDHDLAGPFLLISKPGSGQLPSRRILP